MRSSSSPPPWSPSPSSSAAAASPRSPTNDNHDRSRDHITHLNDSNYLPIYMYLPPGLDADQHPSLPFLHYQSISFPTYHGGDHNITEDDMLNMEEIDEILESQLKYDESAEDDATDEGNYEDFDDYDSVVDSCCLDDGLTSEEYETLCQLAEFEESNMEVYHHEYYFPDYADCPCCKGYVNNCKCCKGNEFLCSCLSDLRNIEIDISNQEEIDEVALLELEENTLLLDCDFEESKDLTESEYETLAQAIEDDYLRSIQVCHHRYWYPKCMNCSCCKGYMNDCKCCKEWVAVCSCTQPANQVIADVIIANIPQPCFHFQKTGHCKFGNQCKFHHESSSNINL